MNRSFIAFHQYDDRKIYKPHKSSTFFASIDIARYLGIGQNAQMSAKVSIWIVIITLLSCQTASENEQRPNILFIAIDDLNDWLGCMQGQPQVKTPHIDRLASKGVLFTNAHCQAPLCGPSRASLMTGLLPSSTGIYGQIRDDKIQDALSAQPEIQFLPQYFGSHGYKTMGVGKLFHHFAPKGVFEVEGGREGGFGPKPEKRFKYDPAWFEKEGNTQTDWGAFPEEDEAMPDFKTAQWTVEMLMHNHDRPFFLAAGFVRPHVPWYVPQKWFDRYSVDSLEMPPYLVNDQDDVPEISRQVHAVPMMPTTEWMMEEDEWRHAVHAYMACITFVDHYVGQILNALERSKYADNTIVVLWSDHGYHIGEKNRFAKHSLWQESSHVPLIISAPGFDGGMSCSKPVQLLDLYPTLVDLASLPKNLLNEGRSLRPLLKNVEEDWTYPAVTTYGFSNHSLKSETHRYIHYEDGSEELYNHQEDPNEWQNLALQAESKPIKLEMKKHLPSDNHRWVKESDYSPNQYFIESRAKHIPR